MRDLLLRLDRLEKEENYRELCNVVDYELKNSVHTSNVWIILAITIIVVPIVDYEASIACLEKALAIEHNNPIALIVLAHVYEYQMGGIDDMLLHQIKSLDTGSDEINSMLKYVASWSYKKSKKDNPEVEEELLKESIRLWDKHVWNHINLMELYKQQGRYLEINNLIYKALGNITKIYDGSNHPDVIDLNEYINEHIKGIYITDLNVESIQQKFVPKHIIFFYTLITPFLDFYKFIKNLFLRTINFEE
jgi:tetratricopeptide (TPR) repeat protein